MTRVVETAVHLRRAIPADRDEQLARMGEIMAARGFIVSVEDIDSAWASACLVNPNRPAWDLVRHYTDENIFNGLMAQLEPVPIPVDEIDLEDPDAEASEEQDDDEPAPREDGGEPAAEQGRQEAAPAKRRGRPPGKRKQEGL